MNEYICPRYRYTTNLSTLIAGMIDCPNCVTVRLINYECHLNSLAHGGVFYEFVEIGPGTAI